MKNSIRISGGYLKGKNIPFDHKSSLRPTSNKLREILFDWLQFEIKDFECLDLFSGTGALGIEAISRGAKNSFFVELNKKNYRLIKSNLKQLELESKSTVLFKDAISWTSKNDLSQFNLIFVDPPFNKDIEEEVLEVLASNKTLSSACKIYLEHSKFSSIEIPSSFTILKEKNVGDVKAYLLRYET
jgi:16S rRNA (guanine966-N2)-methyltransferase